MDPYFEIDLVRLKASLNLAVSRQRTSFSKYAPFLVDKDVDGFIRVMQFLGARASRDRETKNKIREAASRFVRIVEPGPGCFMSHCMNNNYRYPYNCSAGKVPSRCKKVRDFRERWRADMPECEVCKRRNERVESPYGKPLLLCRVSNRPDTCPKRAKAKGR